MYCKQCGSQLSDDARFCRNCGAVIQPTPFGSTMPGVYQPVKSKKKVGFIVIGVLVCIALVLLTLVIADPFGWFESDIPDIIDDPSPINPGGQYGTDVGPDNLRDNYCPETGDSYTLLLYFVGSDLETDNGCASADIAEILSASYSDNLNIILQTGGAKKWHNKTINSADSVSRWQLKNGKLVLLEELGRTSMLTKSALTDFIRFGSKNFPADRTSFIFWDHGGGSLEGFGYDQLFTNDVLILSNISEAFKAAKVKFDFVGFDACLMSSFETAVALEPYADYMIASEQTEPGSGWYYTKWISSLAKNPGIKTTELGKKIIDDYIGKVGSRNTLALVELRKVPYLYSELNKYFLELSNNLNPQSFASLTQSRAKSASLSYDDYDLIDLYDFVEKTDLRGSDKLLEAIDSTLKYRNNCSVAGINGLSFYFPYHALDEYEDARYIFSRLGYGDNITKFFDSFVNVVAKGQLESNSSSFSSLTDGFVPDFSQYSWFTGSSGSDYTYESLDFGDLVFVWSETAEGYIIPLTDRHWDLIESIELHALYDDGEGYIDLGSDQMYYLDGDDNLLMNFDNTWVAIDGQVVPYYALSVEQIGDESQFTGYVPAILNDETRIQVILQWDTADADGGFVAGYVIDGEFSTVGKGYKDFYVGDVLTFLCDYYDYNGDYDREYSYGEPLTIGEYLPSVSYEDLGDQPISVCYKITDIYQNVMYTETLEYSY